VLGFPVHLDLSFLLVLGLLGYMSGITTRHLPLWVVIGTLAVLVHELGHAAAARTAGAQPHIALIGFGGVTTFVPPQPLSRLRSLGISLAGPAVGLLIGGGLLLLKKELGIGLDPFSWQADALRIGIVTCLGWSVLNLLPVLPLDGGQAMRELLPGDPSSRTRRAAGVSVAVAGLAAISALLASQPFLGVFMLFFGLNNVLALRQLAAERRSGPGGGGDGPGGDGPGWDRDGGGGLVAGRSANGTPEQAVVALLWRGDPSGARQLLESLPTGTPVDLAVHGAVLALTGDRDGGHALLAQEAQLRPADTNTMALLLLTQTLEHDWDAVLATVHGPRANAIPDAVVERAISEAQRTGREDVAGRLTARHRPA
jgi:Zn-dependent protease